MGWGDSFKQKWDGATAAAKQQVSQLATGAKAVGVKAVEAARQTADQAAAKAAEAAKWARETSARVAQEAQQKAAQAAAAAKQKAAQAAQAAKQKAAQASQAAQQKAAQAKQAVQNKAGQVAQAAQQKAGQAAAAAKQAAAATAKQVKQTFSKIKQAFGDWKASAPVVACPLKQHLNQPLYFDPKQPARDGQLKTGFDAALYQYQNSFAGGSVAASGGYAGVDVDGFKVGGEAAAAKGALTLYPPGENPCNPAGRLDVEGKLMSAGAKGDFLVGYDSNRYGVSLGVDASASYASIKAKPEVNIPIPFTDWTFGVRAGVGADAGPSAGAGGHAYYDAEEQRGHVGLFGKVIGGASLDLSLGKKYTTQERRVDW